MTRSIEGMEIASHARRAVFVADSARQDGTIIFEGCFRGVSAEDFFVSVCIDTLDFSIILFEIHSVTYHTGRQYGFQAAKSEVALCIDAGNETQASVPPPGASLKLMRQPCAWQSCCVMASPRPLPPVSWLRDESSRKKG